MIEVKINGQDHLFGLEADEEAFILSADQGDIYDLENYEETITQMGIKGLIRLDHVSDEDRGVFVLTDFGMSIRDLLKYGQIVWCK